MKIKELISELLVEDMTKTVRFYEDVLGFTSEVVFPEKNPVFVKMKKDGASVMLYARGEFEHDIPKLKKVSMGGSCLLYVKAEDIEVFYTQIKDKVVIIQPIHKTDYGTLEFTIEDCNGYLIAFSEDVLER